MSRIWKTVCLACVLALGMAGCAPTVEFSADPTGGTQPVKVTFKDKSASLDVLRINYNGLAPIYGWQWDFGDGTGSTAQNPVHDYTIAGEYTVSLTASNTFGTTTKTVPGLIKVTTPASGPTGKFSFTVDATDPLKLNFKDESITGSRPITTWLWDFGDNKTSTEQNPSHTYAAAGIYKVALRVTTVVSSDDEELSVPVAQAGPTAEFRSQADSTNSLIILFTDESVAGSQAITKWEWNFGDTATSTEQNPRHTYANAGEYDVTLKVTTKAGTNSKTEDVTVVAPVPIDKSGS